MSDEMIESLLEKLRTEVLEEVRRVLPRLVTPPRVLTIADAARELSISPSKLKGLVKTGQVATCLVGKTKMIPRSEIERIEASATTETKAPRTSGRRPKAPKYDARAEAASLREELKKRIREGR